MHQVSIVLFCDWDAQGWHGKIQRPVVLLRDTLKFHLHSSALHFTRIFFLKDKKAAAFISNTPSSNKEIS